MIAYATFNSSSAKLSKLWQAIEPWIGRIPVSERCKYDLESLLHNPAMLTLVHTQTPERVYANIILIKPLPPEQPSIVPSGHYVREKFRSHDKAA